MGKKSNKRIPIDTFIADKKVSDLVYGKFQLESKFIEKGEPRVMDKVKLKKSEWAQELGMSRPTLDTKIKYLKKVKLIVDKDDCFEIPEFGKRYFLIPDDTLRFLVNTTNADVIKVYTHLGSLWNQDEATASFTQNQLITLLGYAAAKPQNHKKIADILLLLKNNGLLRWEQRQVGTNKVQFITHFSDKVKGMK